MRSVSSKAKKWRRRGAAALVALVVVIGGGTYLLTTTGPKKTYRLLPATISTVSQTVSTTGTIEAASQANLNFAVSGRVDSVNVATGNKVSAGEVLASVNNNVLQAQVTQAQATLSADQAKLAADQAASASQVQLSADQAAVTAAQDALQSAQQSLADANLTTPISGTVAEVNLTVGQDVPGGAGQSGSSGSAGSASSSTSSSGGSTTTPQVVVIGNNGWTVSAAVGDTQIGKIQGGEQASIVPDGSTSSVYGTVASVGTMATQTSGVPTFPVTIDVTGSPGGLFVGAQAEVSIVVRQLTNVLTVPSAAIHSAGSSSVVYQLVGGKQVARKVTVGVSSGRLTQIVSGLSAGDQVVLPVIGARGGAGGGFGGRPGGFGGILGKGRKPGGGAGG